MALLDSAAGTLAVAYPDGSGVGVCNMRATEGGWEGSWSTGTQGLVGRETWTRR